MVPEVPHQSPKALGIIIPWRRDKLPTTVFLGFPGGSVGKEWVSEVAQLCPTLCDPMDCSLPGSFIHGIFQTRVLEWVVDKEYACKAGDLNSIPGLGRSPGGGHGNPLQYSFPENPMDRGAWQAAVHGAAKSRTWLSDSSQHSDCMVSKISSNTNSSWFYMCHLRKKMEFKQINYGPSGLMKQRVQGTFSFILCHFIFAFLVLFRWVWKPLFVANIPYFQSFGYCFSFEAELGLQLANHQCKDRRKEQYNFVSRCIVNPGLALILTRGYKFGSCHFPHLVFTFLSMFRKSNQLVCLISDLK